VRSWEVLPARQTDREVAGSRGEGLPAHEVDGVSARKPLREVVVHRPGEARTSKEERTHKLDLNGARPPNEKEGAREDRQDPEDKAATKVLPEEGDREQDGEGGLEVEEERARDARNPR
jgi:hypothetical protein